MSETDPSNTYPALFEPLTLRSGVQLASRLVMAPMTTTSSDAQGHVTPAELSYYAKRSDQVGMVITACANVTANGQGFPGEMGAERDELIPSLRSLAEAIRGQGAKAVLQIFHGGRQCPPELVGGDVVSASAVPAEREGAPVPRALSGEEVRGMVAAFGEATRRAIEAGYDGVEIHGANGYLIQQFFSPHSNRREDEWGGDVTGRMAFPLAVVDAVQAAVKAHAKGPFLVGYRFSPEEPENPGIGMPDTLALIDALAGKALDYLHVSLMDYRSLPHTGDTGTPRLQALTQLLGGRTPLIGVGAVWGAQDAQAVLDAGAALVALGRPIIVEPDWADKVRAGKADELRRALRPDEQQRLDVPDPLWNLIMGRKGWFPVEGLD